MPTSYVWTGPKSGSRYKEYLAAKQYGYEYVPGQAAGTAAKAYADANAAAPVEQQMPEQQMPEQQQQLPAPAPISTEPATPWTLEGDAMYQSALSAGQAQFNYARNAALADKQGVQSQKAGERQAVDVNAAESRRRTAGNFASRGMAGGAAGALALAEAGLNADQIAARTSIQDQLAAVNQAYLQNYGAAGTDWTGTNVGQQYKAQAAQQAISAQLARYGV